MSQKMYTPSASLLRCFRHTLRKNSVASRLLFHNSPRRFEEEEGRSFQGQLYESTARRIKRQREAEARFAGHNETSNMARNFAFTFCASSSPQQGKWLTVGSNIIFMRTRLLVRFDETRFCVVAVHSTFRRYATKGP